MKKRILAGAIAFALSISMVFGILSDTPFVSAAGGLTSDGLPRDFTNDLSDLNNLNGFEDTRNYENSLSDLNNLDGLEGYYASGCANPAADVWYTPTAPSDISNRWEIADGAFKRKDDFGGNNNGDRAAMVEVTEKYIDFELEIDYKRDFSDGNRWDKSPICFGAEEKGKYLYEKGGGYGIFVDEMPGGTAQAYFWATDNKFDTAGNLTQDGKSAFEEVKTLNPALGVGESPAKILGSGYFSDNGRDPDYKYVPAEWHHIKLTVRDRVMTLKVDDCKYEFTVKLPESYKGGYIYFAAGGNMTSFKNLKIKELNGLTGYYASSCANPSSGGYYTSPVLSDISNQWDIEEGAFKRRDDWGGNNNGDRLAMVEVGGKKYCDFELEIDYKKSHTTIDDSDKSPICFGAEEKGKYLLEKGGGYGVFAEQVYGDAGQAFFWATSNKFDAEGNLTDAGTSAFDEIKVLNPNFSETAFKGNNEKLLSSKWFTDEDPDMPYNGTDWHHMKLTVRDRVMTLKIDNRKSEFTVKLPESYKGGYIYFAAGGDQTCFKNLKIKDLDTLTPVISVQSVEITTDVDNAAVLPDRITVYTENDRKDIGVEWQQPEDYNDTTPGTYIFTGVLSQQELAAHRLQCEIPVTAKVCITPRYPKGDVNRDAELNIKDLICIKKYLAGFVESADPSIFDLNEDGLQNAEDIALLGKMLLIMN